VNAVVRLTQRSTGLTRSARARGVDNTGDGAQYNGKIKPLRLPSAMKINREEWQHLLELLGTALELDAPQREAWLNGLEGESTRIKQQLQQLLAQPGGTGEWSFLSSPLFQLGPPDESDETFKRKDAPTEVSRSLQAPAAPAETPCAGSDNRLEDPHTWTGTFGECVGIGTVLNDRYVVEQKLGEGGMGTVYLVRDEIERDRVAIKILKENLRAHPEALEALREEVRKTRALAGPNIVGVYDLNRDRSQVYVKMEYLQGKSLEALLDEDFARGMPFSRAWPIIRGMCAGLAYAHDHGVIHLDLKPSNIFITTAGIAKVLDFGIARALRSPRGHYDPAGLGALTPAYASCEMFERRAPDVRDDVYSLACVIYELLTGKHPFGKWSAIKARDEKARVVPILGLSHGQNAALARGLAFSRERRTPSVEALLEGLEDADGRRIRSVVRVVVATVTVLALAAGAWFGFGALQQRAADTAFVESLVRPNAERATNYDPQTVSDLLDQGDDYVRQARSRFDPALLSEGVSTAYGAYRSALKIDAANRRAAEGVLNVLHLYQAEARRLAREGQFKRALELVAIAQKIDPNNQTLKSLKDDLVSKSLLSSP
jgi:serine/threonine protein kinase